MARSIESTVSIPKTGNGLVASGRPGPSRRSRPRALRRATLPVSGRPARIMRGSAKMSRLCRAPDCPPGARSGRPPAPSAAPARARARSSDQTIEQRRARAIPGRDRAPAQPFPEPMQDAARGSPPKCGRRSSIAAYCASLRQNRSDIRLAPSGQDGIRFGPNTAMGTGPSVQIQP